MVKVKKIKCVRCGKRRAPNKGRSQSIEILYEGGPVTMSLQCKPRLCLCCTESLSKRLTEDGVGLHRFLDPIIKDCSVKSRVIKGIFKEQTPLDRIVEDQKKRNRKFDISIRRV
jgi:hypothetical protein